MSLQSFSEDEVSAVWRRTCTKLENQLSPAVYNTWILANPLTQVVDDNSQLIATITSPTAFHATNLKRNLNQQLVDAMSQVVGKTVVIQYEVGSSENSHHVFNQPKTKQSNHDRVESSNFNASQTSSPSVSDLFSDTTIQQSQEDRARFRSQQIGLNPDFVFASFAVSSSNEMAHAAAVAVSKSPGSSYNPLFLYGSVGVGKTHLMHAIGNNLLAQNPDHNILYCTGEEFTNEIVQAIQTKRAADFKRRFRSAEILMIDDIQFIAGKNTVQEEFFHTFNALIQQRNQVILTSDRPPSSISLLEDRLRSRFEAGLMIDIGQPTFELRTAILLLKAKQYHLDFPIELAKKAAEAITSARKIEGFITNIRSEIELKHKVLDETLIQSILQQNESTETPKLLVNPSDVIKEVARYYQLRQTEIKGKQRLKHLVAARHLAMFIMKEDLKLPLVEIGRWFAGRDHTSVIHGTRKISKELAFNTALQQDLLQIKSRLL
ncbi:chromosomal replication initiator protein DnaA [Candidatus Woesebacteria bacterium]|nr:chromosomal replication initiator protein DnaA [Candidatus Woesebacteria bacterium]